jgi:2-hydroxychromene-2-carboxylate isomerase
LSKSVELFFDVGSPASYLAWTQLPGICDQAGAELVYRPMLLGAVFKATGNSSPANVPAKGRYMNADLARYAIRYGVAFHQNPHFPIITLTLMRGAAGVQWSMPERFGDYLRCVFEAMWVKELNMNDPGVVAAALREAGFESEEFMALVNNAAVKDRLRATTDEAVERGVFGAPSMFVNGTLFFGQDRLDFVREALA